MFLENNNEVENNTFATLGKMDNYPGSSSAVAERVKFTVDTRSPKSKLIDQVVEEIIFEVNKISK